MADIIHRPHVFTVANRVRLLIATGFVVAMLIAGLAVFTGGSDTTTAPSTSASTPNVVDPTGLGAALSVTYPTSLTLTPEELGYPEAEFADDVGSWILGSGY